MKKFFRRSLACIIAVVMIATSLPFSAITAGAATENKTINRSYYGFYASSDRTATNGFVLVNDSQNSNFSVGYVTFDISGINYTEAKRISATYTFNINLKETESLGVSVYYPTANVDSFAAGGRHNTFADIWSGNDGNHISRAKTYWGLKHIASYPTKANANLGRTVDLGPAIVAAKKAGKTTATIVFMLSKAGESGGTNGWSDTTITCSNTTASVTIYDFSDRNFTAYEATKYGSFLDDGDNLSETEYNNLYKNVLYAPNNMQEAYLSGAKSAEGKDKIYLQSHIFYGNTVLLYNGNTVPQFPIGFAITGKSKPWNYNYNNVRSHYCRISDGANGLTIQNKKWKGRDGRNNVQYILNAQAEVDVYSDNTSVGYKQGETGYYANIMQYTGGNFTESYKKINPTFEYKVGTDEGTPQVHTTGSVSDKSIYVLNYKKIIDKVNSVNSFLTTFDDSIYDTTTLNAYYNAIYKMFAFDPSLYDYDANTEQAVKDAANDMDSLIAAVDTAYNNLKYNYVFKRINGTVLGTIPAKTYSEARTATLAYGYDPSKATDKTSDGAGNHTWTTYAWPDTVAEGVYEIVEVDTQNSEKCTDDGTGKCSVCGGTLLDKTALNGAKAQAETILNAGNADGKYVADTYQNLFDVYNRIKDVVPTTQDQVNLLTSELLTAISSLISSSVTITFTKSQNGTPVGDAQVIDKKYGDTVELSVSDGDVKEWEIKNRVGKDNEVVSYVRTGENTLSLVVTENISVIAHLAENSTSQHNITKVVFMGRNNNIVAIKYLEPGKSFATSDVAIPAIPFYKAVAWDKTEVKGLANGGEITVRAQYNFNVADADAHKCGIHFEKFAGGVRNYNYDSFVKLYGSSTYYGMYSEAVDVTQDEAKTKLLTYFKTDEFYAPHNSNIYVYALDSAPTTASVGVTGSYHVSDDTNNVAAFNCKFFVPEGATVAEWGIKATANGTVYNFKSNNKTSRNEYTFKVNVAKVTGIGSVLAKAYIIYFDANGDRITLLSNNEVAVNFN